MADDDDTQCTLCYETYSDSDEGRIPRNLICGHTYCTECMGNLRDNANGSDCDELIDYKFIDEIPSSIECPQCKKTTKIRNGDVSNLAKNYAFLNLMERMKNLQVTAEGSKKYKCTQHSGEDLRYWCNMSGCQKPVCSRCLLEGSHQNHQWSSLVEVTGTKRETLQERLAEATEITAAMEEGFECVASEIKNLQELGESAKGKIKEKFQGMRSSLDRREKELLENIDHYIEDTEETLESQRQFLEEHMKRGRAVCKEAKLVADGHELEVLTKFKDCTGRMWELADASQGVVTEPLVRPVIRFRSETRDTIQQIERYGELCFEEQKPQTQRMRTFEQGVAERREGAPQVAALSRHPLQRREEKLAVETISLGSLSTVPPTSQKSVLVTEAATYRVDSPPSSLPRRVHQTCPSDCVSPARREDDTPFIPGLRVRSREPSQMSLLHTVTSPPPPAEAATRVLPEVVPSHSSPKLPSWKERVSYVNQEGDLLAEVGYPTDSYHGNRVEPFAPAALPPAVSSPRGGSSSKESRGEMRWGTDVESVDNVTPPGNDGDNGDIWSAALKGP